ncbi:MAG: group III truncated hemoglobin [Burkholderiaceae bacterium]|nr:group III truncated hemoglobin [Burkholderiaceae bacterium]
MASISTRESGAICREDLAQLVCSFYDDIRRDELLGPVFEPVIGAHWEQHLERMTDFWSTVMLGSRSFRGNVFSKHVALAETTKITPEHFLRWITLWHRHTSALFDADIAEELQQTAQGIGRNLFYGFFEQFARFIVQDGVAVAYEAV